MESRVLGLSLVQLEKLVVCRLCMLEHEYGLSVFLANELSMTSLGEVIRDLLNLEVSEGDGLPATACGQCVEKLMEFRKFKEMCVHSAKELRRHVLRGGGVLKLRCSVEGEGVAVGLMDGEGGICCTNVEDESPVPNEACDPLAYDNLCLVKDDVVPMQLLGEVASTYMSYSVECKSGVPVVGNDLSLDPLSLKNETDTQEVYPRDPLGDCDDCPEEDTAEGECNENAAACTELIPFVVGDQGEVKKETEYPELAGKGRNHSNDGYEGYSSVTGGPSLLSDPLAAMGVVDCCNNIGKLTLELEKESDKFEADGQFILNNEVLNDPSCDLLREENLQLEHSMANWFVVNCLPEERVKNQKKNVSFYASSKKQFSRLNDRARPIRNQEREQLCHQAENANYPTDYICNYCSTRYLEKESLAVHIKRHVVGMRSNRVLPKKDIPPRFSENLLGKAFKCNECGKQFSTKRDISSHLLVHSGEKPFKCNECGKMFTQRGSLKTHSAIHTGVKRFKCKECGKMFTQRGSLKRHSAIHTGLKRFKCNECGKMFTQRGSLKTHSVIHTGVKPFKCNECEKMFTQKSSLKTHSFIHTDVQRFKCNECGKMFTHSCYLKTHSLIHTGVKRFKCNECGKMFTTKVDLKRHLVVHYGVKPFKCNECGKMFSTCSNFNMHSVVHTGVKRIKCNECGKMFTTKGDFRKHSVVHTGVKRFKCEECGKMFTTSSNLRKHSFVHTGVKRFKCEECGKMFTTSSNLARHSVVHTGKR